MIDVPSIWTQLDYPFVLEVSNGFGFMLSLMLMVTLLAILISRVKERGWIADYVAQLTFGMVLVKVGLTLGLGYRWLIARCRNVQVDCAYLEDDFWILFVSVVFIAAGGLLILRVLSREEWRPWSWLGAAMVSFMVPFIYYTFDTLFPTTPIEGGEVVQGHYALDRVILSLVVSVFGSYVALDVAHRAQRTTGWRQALWVAGAGIVLGGSIWSMHFIAMLAFEIPGVQVQYDYEMTALSLAFPIGFTLIGIFAAVNSPDPGWGSMMASATLIAFGVVTMHYTGMAAMEMNAVSTFDLTWVMVSVVIAILGSFAAVWLVFQEANIWQRVIAAFILGLCGISGLHYSAMVAFICRVAGPAPDAVSRPLGGLTQGQLAFTVGVVTFVILGAFLSLSIYDRRKEGTT